MMAIAEMLYIMKTYLGVPQQAVNKNTDILSPY